MQKISYMLCAMKPRHPDSDLIDAIGADRIKHHFQITRQALQYWRINGVPKRHRRTLDMLAAMGTAP